MEACATLPSSAQHQEVRIAFRIELEPSQNGWQARITDRPDVLVCGSTRAEAVAKAEALALRWMAHRIEFEEAPIAAQLQVRCAV